MIKKIALVFGIVFAAVLAYGQGFEKRVDSLLFSTFTDTTGPGAVFMIAKDKKIIYQKAFGKANLELNVVMEAGNVFQLGSMTKQFTAVSILILEEQGLLNVTNPVSKFIPDYPGGDKITIHHLLTHTSGIKDFTKMKALSTIAKLDLSPKEVVDFFKNEPVDFQPGERFEYNNSGYVLLGYIIELVSGMSYESFVQRYIFEKAGMRDSRYASDRTVINKRAYGYHKKEYGYVNKTSISFNIPYSSGSLMSTVSDMLKWQNALNQNILLRRETLMKAFGAYSLNNGEKFNYGYGWHLKEIGGTSTREHGGSIFGFKTMGVYIPEKDIYVIGLTNCDCISPTQAARELATLTLMVFKDLDTRKR